MTILLIIVFLVSPSFSPSLLVLSNLIRKENIFFSFCFCCSSSSSLSSSVFLVLVDTEAEVPAAVIVELSKVPSVHAWVGQNMALLVLPGAL